MTKQSGKLILNLKPLKRKKIVYVDESYSNSRATGHTFTFTPPAVPERQPIEDVYPKLKKLYHKKKFEGLSPEDEQELDELLKILNKESIIFLNEIALKISDCRYKANRTEL